MQQLETDYLIVGSGAVGMAFADTLLTESDAKIVIVDRHHKPGGHWNDAYSFVCLHQPSAIYGVNSKPLGGGTKDKTGLNKGLYELASGAEVSSYFDQVMRQQFIPSGRVQYFPMCVYTGNGEFYSLLSGEKYQVKVKKKTVDATYFQTSVPSTHTPNFNIAPGVKFAPLNALPDITSRPSGYVVIGGGKTGIDACLWLLENKVDPDSIRWIMPRDGWLINRETTQPYPEFFVQSIGGQADQMEALAKAESIDDLFDRLEASGVMLRLDKNVKPEMFHGATMSVMEVKELQKIKNVIRLGRVTSLDQESITLQHGCIPTDADTMHIDCSASAVPPRETLPVFNADLITIQTVRTVQPVFSAAFAAFVELNFSDEAEKNRICSVVPLPNHATDWLKVTSSNMKNQYIWSKNPVIREWLVKSRLDGFTAMVQKVKLYEFNKIKVLKRFRTHARPAIAKLEKFLQEIA
jgi:hypothetical protein